MADKDAVPTVIYDEIDSGVSGKAASRIGEVLRQSAEGHQILCITHTAHVLCFGKWLCRYDRRSRS